MQPVMHMHFKSFALASKRVRMQRQTRSHAKANVFTCTKAILGMRLHIQMHLHAW